MNDEARLSHMIQKINRRYALSNHRISDFCLLIWLGYQWLNLNSPHPVFSHHPELNHDLINQFKWLDGHVTGEHLNELGELRLSDVSFMEEMYQRMLGGELRETTGSYYTTGALADFMVKETLRTHYCKNMQRESSEHFIFDQLHQGYSIDRDEADRLLNWLEGLSVLDLSCGGGIFLRCAVKRMMRISQTIHQAAGIPFDTGQAALQIVNRITGVDQQNDALLLSELLIKIELIQLLNQESALPVQLKLKLVCADALTWVGQKQESYQIILGNPPYIGEKGNRTLFEQIRQTDFGQRFYEKNMDLSYFFLYRGIGLLAPDGCLCYVMTSYFTTADGGRKLRKLLRSSTCFHWLVNADHVTIFPHAKGQHNLIFCLGKRSASNIPVKLLHIQTPMIRTEFFRRLSENGLSKFGQGGALTCYEDTRDLFDHRGQLLARSSGNSRKMIDMVEFKTKYHLQDLCSVNQGLVSGADKVTKRHGLPPDQYRHGQGIFVLSSEEKRQLTEKNPVISALIKPFYKNSQIRPFQPAEKTDHWLLYLTDHNLPDLSQIPELEEHLTPFKEILAKRREVDIGIRKWHSLHWPRFPALFEGRKIVAPQRASLNTFALVEGPWYASADVYFIHRRDSCLYSIEYLQAWLNSALCYGWLRYYGKMKGKDLELYATPLRHIPVPEPPDKREEKWIVESASVLCNPRLSLSERMETNRRIDLRFLEWHGFCHSQAEELIHNVDSLRLDYNRHHR